MLSIRQKYIIMLQKFDLFCYLWASYLCKLTKSCAADLFHFDMGSEDFVFWVVYFFNFLYFWLIFATRIRYQAEIKRIHMDPDPKDRLNEPHLWIARPSGPCRWPPSCPASRPASGTGAAPPPSGIAPPRGTGAPVKHGSVFLVPGEKLLVQCTCERSVLHWDSHVYKVSEKHRHV